MKFKSILSVFILVVCFFSFSESRSQMDETETTLLISTNMGDIKIVLFNDTRIHKKNFLMLAKSGQFNGSTFHRVIKSFMIQGGKLPNPKRPVYTLPAEIKPGYVHTKGMLSAARKPDQVNPMKESSGSQFYIVQGKKYSESELARFSQRSGFQYTEEQKKAYAEIGGTPHLDGEYTVFGKVIEGLDIVDKIAAVETGARDVPIEEITMQIKVIQH